MSHIFRLINEFGNLLGYKINCKMSEAITLNCMISAADLSTIQKVWKKR